MLKKLEKLETPKKLPTLLQKLKRKINLENAMGFPLTICGIVLMVTLLYLKANEPKANDPTASSVMITNISGNSGGTGIILSSSETHSEILTNSHVCRVVEHGGLVSGRAGTFLVASYKPSHMHDLCMITVEGNLRVQTKVASKAPVAYYESALVSGHPALMPNVVTTGHFSGRKVIAVMKGIKPCTPEQQADPGTGLFCTIVGGIPDIVQYDSTLVTATIMPGSSGSGVYNENKELAAVIFAGQGDLGYGWAVPFESMKNFLDQEVSTLDSETPDNTVDFTGVSGSRRGIEESKLMEKLKEACEGPNKKKIKETCDLLDQDAIFRK